MAMYNVQGHSLSGYEVQQMFYEMNGFVYNSVSKMAEELNNSML